MPQAYEEASFDGTLPAHARNLMYAVRRLSGLGDRLDSKYFLTRSVMQDYLDDHPEETAEWDIVRDDRGTFHEPHTGREVGLGTIAVREYLSDADERTERQFVDDHAPALSLHPVTDGPLNRFGAVLYIEKEGFLPAIRRARIPERFDLGLASCKGYSVKAARALVRNLADRFDVRVLVARDFDKAGPGIFDTLGDGFEDLGLRLKDIEDEPDLDLMSESVTYNHDPRPNLRLRGATEEEIDFLCEVDTTGDEPVYRGRRVELNALVGQRFIDWLEGKIAEAGVEKVVPPKKTLAMAWQHAQRREEINRAVRAAYAQVRVADGEVPDDLVTMVTEALEADPTLAWDEVVVALAKAARR
jgi:hypothetical protein